MSEGRIRLREEWRGFVGETLMASEMVVRIGSWQWEVGGVIHVEKQRKPPLGEERKLRVVRIFGVAIPGYDFFFLLLP